MYPRRRSSPAKGFNRAEVFSQFLRAVMNGNTAPSQFLEKCRLGKSRNFRGLPQGGFLGDEQANREMQRRVLGRKLRFDRIQQRQLHEERMKPIPAFRKARFVARGSAANRARRGPAPITIRLHAAADAPAGFKGRRRKAEGEWGSLKAKG